MGAVLQSLGLIITFTMAVEALRRIGIDDGWLRSSAAFRRRAGAHKVQPPPLLHALASAEQLQRMGALGACLQAKLTAPWPWAR